MTYDYELTLITETITENSMGDYISTETETKVLCGLKGVNRNEFYQAAATGLKPELVVEVNKYEYTGEALVEFEGTRYQVIRTYPVEFEGLELVCEGLVGEA